MISNFSGQMLQKFIQEHLQKNIEIQYFCIEINTWHSQLRIVFSIRDI